MAAKQNIPAFVRVVLQKLKAKIGKYSNLDVKETYCNDSVA